MSYRKQLNFAPILRAVIGILVVMWVSLITGNAYADEQRYVWALQGVNLRDAPSANAKVITKLNYGDAVAILPSSEAQVPYEMSFFPKAAGQAAKPGAMPVLSGAWIKVQANGQQGYVFDKLLLRYTPIKKGEVTAKYFARIFGLTPKTTKGKGDKDGAEITTYSDHGAKKTAVEVDYYPASSGSMSYATIAGMSFEDAFVMVNAIEPPDLSSPFTYHQGKSFEYQGREGPNCQLSIDNGVVEFDWFDEP